MRATQRSTFDLNPRRNPDDLRQALNLFVLHGRPAWKLHEANGQEYAARRFEYPRGQQAQISLTLGATRWESHITIPFSAGPEESVHGKEIRDIEAWIARQEKTLSVPLWIAECKSYDTALEMAGGLDRWAMYTLSYVLDLDLDVNKHRFVNQLVVACGIARKAA